MPARIQPAFRHKIAIYKETLHVSLKADVPHKGKTVPLHATWAQRGDRGTSRALPIPDPDARRWSKPYPRPLYIRERKPVPIVLEVGCASGRVWTGAEYLAPSVFEPSSLWQVAIPTTLIWPPTSLTAEMKHECTNLPETMINKHFTNPAPSPVHRYSTNINCILCHSQYFRKHSEC